MRKGVQIERCLYTGHSAYILFEYSGYYTQCSPQIYPSIVCSFKQRFQQSRLIEEFDY